MNSKGQAGGADCQVTTPLTSKLEGPPVQYPCGKENLPTHTDHHQPRQSSCHSIWLWEGIEGKRDTRS